MVNPVKSIVPLISQPLKAYSIEEQLLKFQVETKGIGLTLPTLLNK